MARHRPSPPRFLPLLALLLAVLLASPALRSPFSGSRTGLVLFAAADDTADASAEPGSAAEALSEEAVSKMKIKELKKFLADRGQACAGCAEKRDYVEVALAARELPIVERPPEPEKPRASPEMNEDENKVIEELLAKMKQSGQPMPKILRAEDIAKMAGDKEKFARFMAQDGGGAAGNQERDEL
ncbi:hypothetical protein DFJ74DRAFT_675036 [Hyaloraphidium curvatum]|nr:hypothetical protein DFJ74DRAFT_675036 [Hyaloraphidium curvatum]